MTTTTDDAAQDRTDYLARDRYGMYAKHATANDGGGPGPRLMGADTLIGNDVGNGDDEDLGEIAEIMLDMRTGRVAYAVLSFGGFLGMGRKLFAVPWHALALDTANHRFTLQVSRDRLKDAPGFDPDHWPDMADPRWAEDVHTFYGVTYRSADERDEGGPRDAERLHTATGEPDDIVDTVRRATTTVAGSTVI